MPKFLFRLEPLVALSILAVSIGYFVFGSSIAELYAARQRPQSLGELAGGPLYYQDRLLELALTYVNFALLALACSLLIRTLHAVKLLYPTVLSLLLFAICFEAVIAAAVRNPAFAARLPAVLLHHARLTYISRFRDTVNTNPRLHRYDPELTYTLRPGSERFTNSEFDTAFNVNSQGLRDSESALEGPEIVVLGDSFAMGWGVEEEESFPSILEDELGAKTLNAGIASYGTARELMLLKRLDSSKLKTLVIQYSNNDVRENSTYLHRGALEPMPSAEFQRYRELYQSGREYYPGKYLILPLNRALTGLITLQQRLIGRTAERVDESIETEPVQFLDVLRRNHHFFEGRDVKVFVVSLNGYTDSSDTFSENLEQELRGARLGDSLPKIEVIPVSGELTARHGFILDDHLNAEGHRLVGKKLVDAIRNE